MAAKVLAGAVALGALLAGCTAGADTVATAPVAAAQAGVDASPKKACEVAPEDLLLAIAEKGVTGLSLAEGFAVEAAGAEGVYVVAARAAAAGRDAEVALFATQGLDPRGTVLAVGTAAQSLTTWPAATDAALAADTPAAALASECLTG